MLDITRTIALAGVGWLVAVMPAQAERTVRLSYYLSPQHVYAETAVEPFAKEVTECTNGELAIETYPSEQLGKAADSVRTLQSGVADIGWVTFTYHAQEMPATQIVNLPLGLDGETAAAALWRATHEPGIIKDEWDRLGLLPLMILANPAYEIHTTDTPLPDFESLEGLKLRSPGAAYVETIKRLGAIPYEVATPDQYEALQRGLINATIYAFSSWDSFKVNELLNHTTTNAKVVTTGLGVVTTQEFWASLTDKQRKCFKELGRKYSKVGTDSAASRNSEALERYEDEGLQVYEWSEEDRIQLRDALGSVNEEWREEAESAGIDANALFSQFEEFRSDYEASGKAFPEMP